MSYDNFFLLGLRAVLGLLSFLLSEAEHEQAEQSSLFGCSPVGRASVATIWFYAWRLLVLSFAEQEAEQAPYGPTELRANKPSVCYRLLSRRLSKRSEAFKPNRSGSSAAKLLAPSGGNRASREQTEGLLSPAQPKAEQAK